MTSDRPVRWVESPTSLATSSFRNSNQGPHRNPLADDQLDEKPSVTLQLGLSRGHLSRPACSHVKQIAKRPGTRWAPAEHFRPGFLLGKGDPDVRVRAAKLPPRDPARACRHPALAVRRDLGGTLPHPGLRLRERPECGKALQERRAGLSVFALLQPDRDHVRAAHGRARRRRRPHARPRPEWRRSPPR